MVARETLESNINENVASTLDLTLLRSGTQNNNMGSLDQEWIIDSGCTAHLCNNHLAFDTLYPHTEVLKGAGADIVAAGKGTIKLPVVDSNGRSQWLHLENCLYMPDMDVNLLSLHNLLGDGMTAKFGGGTCTISNAQFDLQVPY